MVRVVEGENGSGAGVIIGKSCKEPRQTNKPRENKQKSYSPHNLIKKKISRKTSGKKYRKLSRKIIINSETKASEKNKYKKNKRKINSNFQAKKKKK